VIPPERIAEVDELARRLSEVMAGNSFVVCLEALCLCLSFIVDRGETADEKRGIHERILRILVYMRAMGESE
jgi:hypothetical protein